MTVQPSEFELTDQQVIEDLIYQIHEGEQSLSEPVTTENLVVEAADVLKLIEASQQHNPVDIELHCVIKGDLCIETQIQSGLHIGGRVDGSVYVCNGGSIEKSLHIAKAGSIEGNLYIWSEGYIGQNLLIEGHIEGTLNIRKDGAIKGHLMVRTEGSLGGNLTIKGEVAGLVDLDGSFEGTCRFLSEASIITIGSLRGARFAHHVDFNDYVSLKECDFRGFPSFDKCTFSGQNLFDSASGRQKIRTDFTKPFQIGDEIGLYRQLRRVYENSSNRPGASDFYFREMEARKNHVKQTAFRRTPFLAIALPVNLLKSFEFATLWLYRTVSSYGLNPYRAAAWFIATVFVSACVFAVAGVSLSETASNADGSLRDIHNRIGSIGSWRDASDVLTFSFKSMVSFFSPPKAILTSGEQWLQHFLRFIGPILLSQIVLSTREKVAR